MSDSKMSEMIRASLDGIRDFTSSEISVGNPIRTEAGVTVIPVSKVNVGFASGGLDYGAKKLLSEKSFGGGGGTGISVTPMAFLTINKNADVSLIPVSTESNGIDKLVSLIEHSPELIEKIKGSLS